MMRVSSLAAAVTVLVLSYLLARRYGFGRWAALLPMFFVTCDMAFFQGSLMGRMDMLALAFVLLAVWLDSFEGSDRKVGRHDVINGFVCGLAGLTHPFGVVAFLTLTTTRLWNDRNLRRLPRLCAGAIAPMLPWFAYILQDTSSFVAQFGGQFIRKHTADPISAHGLGGNFDDVLFHYGINPAILCLWMLAGAAGLILAASQTKRIRGFVLCYFFSFALVLWGRSYWYLLYLAVPASMGVSYLLCRRCPLEKGPGYLYRSACALLAVVFVLSGWGKLSHEDASLNGELKEQTDYVHWCQQISDTLPENSKVFLASIPDPALGLIDRKDLDIRQFVPGGIPVDSQAYLQRLEDSDFIIAGRIPFCTTTEAFIGRRGRLVKEINTFEGGGFYARIYAVK